MTTTGFDETVQLPASAAGRRDALRSLGAAGMALLAALGLNTNAAAKKHKSGGGNGGGKGRNKNNRNKNHPPRRGNQRPAGPDDAPPDAAASVQAQANDKKDGPTGPTGPMGPMGPAGADSQAPGPTGPQGLQGVTGVFDLQHFVNEGSSNNGFAFCPSGTTLIGGGVHVTNTRCYTVDGQRGLNFWVVKVGCPAGESTVFIPQAICAF